MEIIKNTYFTRFFFLILLGIISIFTISYSIPFLFIIGQILLIILVLLLIYDVYSIYNKQLNLNVTRLIGKVLSLDSENLIQYTISNEGNTAIKLTLYDEFPEQLQLRDTEFKVSVLAKEKISLQHYIIPKQRGEYIFKETIALIQSKLGFVNRKVTFDNYKNVPVYPSLIQMKQFDLLTSSKIATQSGITKLRRLGQSYELEHIKSYVFGDDFRNINWKATSRNQELMVNQFEEEKSQQVYCIIDCSRSMLLPFGGLSLMDYSINTSLVISNAAVKKEDKIGLISFSNEVDTIINPDKTKKQLFKILDSLYKLEEQNCEANYELLFYKVKYAIKTRSLLFLFTNFESSFSLERVLPILRKLNALHLFVIVVFENHDLIDYSKKEVKNTQDIFLTTVAHKYVMDKKQILSELRKFGIQVIYTRPENLSINTLNKYLELKARGLI